MKQELTDLNNQSYFDFFGLRKKKITFILVSFKN
tara:strand:- start:4342 stop:4443 length:102 start_codon:yes stop_codon:yes gene_type:complete